MSEFDPIKMEKEIRMGMNLVDRDEFNATIRAVSHIAAKTVQKTLGPYAHTTIIDDGTSTHPTKDGWSILQRLRFQDPTHQSIFTMLKNISFRIVDKVGDGTTTAMVTADHFMDELSEWLKNQQNEVRQNDIVNALNDVRDAIINILKGRAVQIDPKNDFKEIYQIALVSSNGNEKLAKIMQEIYQKTNNPNVLVDMEGGRDISYEIQEGYRLDISCLMHERYINTNERYFSSNGQPHMLFIFDHNVTYQKHAEMINALMVYASQRRCFPVIMAPNYDDVMTSTLSIAIENQIKQMQQKAQGKVMPTMMVIQIPEMMRTLQKEYVNDFAALAGGNLINSTKVKLFNELRHNEKVEDDTEKIRDKANELEGYQFATAQEVVNSCGIVVSNFILGKNFITLQDIDKENPYYQSRLKSAKEAYALAVKNSENSPTSYTKELLDATQRLNKLSGALGVIHVGGVTDLERECNKDFVDDTFQACRSAYENGIVPGMNLGTLCAIDQYLHEEHSDLQVAVANILDRAFIDTTTDLLSNKKASDWYLSDQYQKVEFTATGLIEGLVNMINEGRCKSYDMVTETIDNGDFPRICNSVSTDIEILYGITSILGMILTSDQYLSVNRMYDKMAAIRQQEAINEKSIRNKVDVILSAVDEYIEKNPDKTVTKLIEVLSRLAE